MKSDFFGFNRYNSTKSKIKIMCSRIFLNEEFQDLLNNVVLEKLIAQYKKEHKK